MSRSLIILVVTIVVVAAFYYGFSRFATPAAPGAGETMSAPPAASSAAPPAASSAAPGGANAIANAPGASARAEQHATPPTTTAATPAPAAGTRAPGTFTIAISEAHPPAPSDVIRVNKDDQVTLSITSDRAGHVEVHGYRKEVEVEPGTTATLSFAAVRTGRFPIDLHGSDGAHVEVTALEVLPR